MWEGRPCRIPSKLLRPKSVLLAVCCVPNPVHEQVSHKKKIQHISVQEIRVWVVVGQVDGTMAIAERDSSEVPEDQHEAPFFVVHIPGVYDHFFCFAAGIGVEEVG